MKAIAITVGYLAPFATFLVVPADFTTVFLSVYFTAILVSLSLPGLAGDLVAKRSSDLYKGLLGAILGLFLVALYLESISGLFPQSSAKVVGLIAATWILFSLMIMVGSVLSVSRLGLKLAKNGLDGMKSQDGGLSGTQHFALEFCGVRWFSHPKYCLYSLATVAMFLYGWFLLGIPFFIYSLPLLILTVLSLRSLSSRLVSPLKLSEVVAKIHLIVSSTEPKIEALKKD